MRRAPSSLWRRLHAAFTITTSDDDPLVDQAPPVPIRTIFRRFWPYTRPDRAWMVVGLLVVAIGPMLDTLAIWLFKILVDDVLTPRDFSLFPQVAAGYVAITLVGGLRSFADRCLSTWVAQRFLLDVRGRLFEHLQRLSMDFFERRRLGDVLARLTGDVGAIESLVLSGITRLASYLVKIVLFTAALFWLNWRLAALSLVAVPAFWLMARRFSGVIKAASREKRRRSGSISAVAEESLGNAALVQAYGLESDQVQRFRTQNLASMAAEMTATRLRALFSPLIEMLELIGILAVLGFGTWELSQDRISLGGMLVFLAYLTQLYSPVRGLGRLSNSVYAASAGAERIIEVLDQEPSVRPPVEPLPLRRARGLIDFEDVAFSYPGSEQKVLDGVDLHAEPGQTVALVGLSGAGKTTIGKLLLRFYDPLDGVVRIDGVSLRDLDTADLRRNVSVLMQETLVIDGTVADNIRMGRPGASDDDVRAAAAAADADDFIRQLDGGYDFRVGQRGRRLSGGQRQRVAIARAMIRDAPVLLLDEPTTGLDALSSHRILTPLRRLMTGRTTIVVSHNLLTVTDVDTIVHLHQGRVAGVGNHRHLLRSDPGYRTLFELHRAPTSEATTA